MTPTLRLAADILRQHGWCQDVYIDQDGRRCLSAAIAEAATGQPMSSMSFDLRLAIERTLRQAGLPAVAHHLEHWNNAPNRTRADIFDFLQHGTLAT